MLRLYSLGAIFLPTSQEYQKGTLSSSTQEILVNTPLYIGGVPYSVNTSKLYNKGRGFIGCLRRFEMASSFSYYLLNLGTPDLRESSAGASSCYSNVESGTYYNGSAWIQYGEMTKFLSTLHCIFLSIFFYMKFFTHFDNFI